MQVLFDIEDHFLLVSAILKKSIVVLVLPSPALVDIRPIILRHKICNVMIGKTKLLFYV